MKTVNHCQSLIASAHRDIDDTLNAALVHHAQHIGWRLCVEVFVIINRRKLGALNTMFWRDEHRARLEIAQAQIHFSLRRDQRDELVLSVSLALTHLPSCDWRQGAPACV